MPETKPDRTIEVRGSRTLADALGEQYENFYKPELYTMADPSGEKGIVAAVPAGKKLESVKRFFDEYLPKPRRRTGTARLRDEISFVEHIARFSSTQSAIFAIPDRAKPSFLAIYDYHPAGDDTVDADWCGHRAAYDVQLSDEWKAWSANDGRDMPQIAFAAFIEDRITDVVAVNYESTQDAALIKFADLVAGRFASPSSLIQASRGLQTNVDAQLREIVTRETGEINLTYIETHNDSFGAPVKVDNLFAIAIPVFFGGPLYRIAVRLRYKITGDKRIVWTTALVRPDVVFDDAFEEARSRIATETKAPVFLGSPEA